MRWIVVSTSEFYVSITGFRLKGRRHLVRFWWHTIRSIAQARRALGNLKAEMCIVNGVYHTLSIWVDEQAMRTFLITGAHRNAMKAYRSVGTGRTLGFATSHLPDWNVSLQRWHSEAREV